MLGFALVFAILKLTTSHAKDKAMNVGEYKRQDNEIVQALGVSATRTAPAAAVSKLHVSRRTSLVT